MGLGETKPFQGKLTISHYFKVSKYTTFTQPPFTGLQCFSAKVSDQITYPFMFLLQLKLGRVADPSQSYS